MIVSLDIVKQENELKDVSDDKLERKLKAIEKAIRNYTNNNFIDTTFRFYGSIKNGVINVDAMSYLSQGDNIELFHSLNNGVYTITAIDESKLTLDCKNLFDCRHIMIAKVVYPEDIQEGVINMLKWDFGLRNKVGIKSESISRHSVTYFDMDKNNTLKGYPISLLGFLDDYVKARF